MKIWPFWLYWQFWTWSNLIKKLKIKNLMIYFNDYFIRNWKCGKSGKFELKCWESQKSILRAFARTRAKKLRTYVGILKSGINVGAKKGKWQHCLDWCKNELKFWCEHFKRGLRLFQGYVRGSLIVENRRTSFMDVPFCTCVFTKYFYIFIWGRP